MLTSERRGRNKREMMTGTMAQKSMHKEKLGLGLFGAGLVKRGVLCQGLPC